MRPNPGGIITGDAIVDREKDIKKIWSALQNQSVVLSSERRVGKTSVLRKMEENPKNDWTPILYWVEGKWHPIEFIEGLYQRTLEKGMIEDKFFNLKKLYSKYMEGKEFGSWKFPIIKENWKALFESLIKDIVTAENKVLFMFDELPLMLSHFISSKECGPNTSMEFLDLLREIRNKYEASKQVAFIFCGSIGIHLIIKDLKRNHGYNSDPINNMKKVTLTGMDSKGAKELCERLMEDQDYKMETKESLLNYICSKTNRLPFYIQHIFAYIEESDTKTLNKELIDKAFTYLQNDPKDEGFFNHYIDRIKTYYEDDYKEIALLILDNICRSNKKWKEEDIINMIHTFKNLNKETIKETINLLWNDHYLFREVKKNIRFYKFNYSILQTWWKINRG
jgi:hypothetical protein